MSKLITILGPTATGKTNIAVNLALELNAEIISADSRQVYRSMDIGTGKDINEYTIDGVKIPFHLIDIINAGEEYNLFTFLKDFHAAYQDISDRSKQSILCGGTGLYLHGVLKGYEMKQVDKNDELRSDLANKTDDELREILLSKVKVHNTTDILSRPRLVRAIEIALEQNEYTTQTFPAVESVIFGVYHDRQIVRDRITNRLKARIEEGMLEEVESLLNSGVSAEQLIRYGLEYKYLTQYIQGELSKDEMINLLNIAIHQFSKRQMTWFRKMEREGINIIWVDGTLEMKEKINFMKTKI
ncbi:MAG: tRNA (adenosine(37)-N6)-dimethylallyltransferase MiaA [Bacteroidota bacterium]